MRMRIDHRAHGRVFLQRGADANRAINLGLRHIGQDLIKLAGKFWKTQVAMGIYEHG